MMALNLLSQCSCQWREQNHGRVTHPMSVIYLDERQDARHQSIRLNLTNLASVLFVMAAATA